MSTCLRSQTVTLETGRGQHRKYLPLAFTEQGVAMLSSVLRSEQAVRVNIEIMRAFVRMRRVMQEHEVLATKLGSGLPGWAMDRGRAQDAADNSKDDEELSGYPWKTIATLDREELRPRQPPCDLASLLATSPASLRPRQPASGTSSDLASLPRGQVATSPACLGDK